MTRPLRTAGRLDPLAPRAALLLALLPACGRGADDASAAPLDLDELAAWLIDSDNHYYGERQVDRYEAAFREAQEGDVPPAVEIQARQDLANILLRHGRVDEAVEHLERALDEARTLAAGAPAPEVPGAPAAPGANELEDRLLCNLAVAYLRQGEVDHCIAMHNPESCLFPIRKGGVWADPSGARKAIATLEPYLARHPDDESMRWLFNVAHMVAGTYPEGVPPELLVPLREEHPIPGTGRFHEIATQLGIATFGGAGGAILDDFDGDGLLDVVTSSMFPNLSLRYYRSRGDGTFEDRTAAAGLEHQLGGLNVVQTDANGDGRLDLFVARGAWMGEHWGRQRNSLLLQEPDGTFTDATAAAGLMVPAYPCLAVGWADLDLDGDLDLYVGNEDFPNQLFRNAGDATFTDIAPRAGVDDRGTTKGVTWGDFDNDGDPDLYVSNLGQPNRLYENRGGERFVDVAPGLDVDVGDPALRERIRSGELEDRSFATWFWDYDNDGWLDLYVGGYSASLRDAARDYLGLPNHGEPLRLYHNDGSGHFVDVTAGAGLQHAHLPMGANYGDVDGDGFPDVYLGTGKPGFEFLLPNLLYRNEGGRTFVDVTSAAGVGHLQKGHGIAFGDLDNDGDLDLLAQMGGFYPDDAFQDAFFENPGNQNAWVTLTLRGTRSNRFAVGARVRVDLATPEGPRSVHTLVTSGGSFGASSLRQEIGLGDATGIERVVVRWPGSGDETFEGIEPRRFYEVVEGAGEPRPLHPPRISLPN